MCRSNLISVAFCRSVKSTLTCTHREKVIPFYGSSPQIHRVSAEVAWLLTHKKAFVCLYMIHIFIESSLKKETKKLMSADQKTKIH